MRIERKPRTVYDEVYISDDGMQFDNKEDCLVHENAIDKVKGEVDKLEITALRYYMPCDGKDHNPDSDFHWYKVSSPQEISMINEYYGIEDGWKLETDAFPVTVCVESNGEAWGYYLNDCIRYVIDFFNGFGVEPELKGVEKWVK